jgi:hypothetical protein
VRVCYKQKTFAESWLFPIKTRSQCASWEKQSKSYFFSGEEMAAAEKTIPFHNIGCKYHVKWSNKAQRGYFCDSNLENFVFCYVERGSFAAFRIFILAERAISVYL